MNAGAGKPIRLSDHARGYLARRGFTESEVHEAIRTSPWQPAQRGRQEAIKDFPYQALWNGPSIPPKEYGLFLWKSQQKL